MALAAAGVPRTAEAGASLLSRTASERPAVMRLVTLVLKRTRTSAWMRAEEAPLQSRSRSPASSAWPSCRMMGGVWEPLLRASGPEAAQVKDSAAAWVMTKALPPMRKVASRGCEEVLAASEKRARPLRVAGLAVSKVAKEEVPSTVQEQPGAVVRATSRMPPAAGALLVRRASE